MPALGILPLWWVSKGELVESWTRDNFPGAEIIWQREQRGTGHAAKLAQEWWQNFENVMVLAGDAPLIKPETLSFFAERHAAGGNACSFLSFDLEDPTGYGRVLREDGKVRVVEHKDATERQREVKEVNSGMYIFDTAALAGVIDKISCANAQGEYYLPDALALIESCGGRVEAVKADHAERVPRNKRPDAAGGGGADNARPYRQRFYDKQRAAVHGPREPVDRPKGKDWA